MKLKDQSIAKGLMIMTVLFGMNMTAHAQFGGLLKKAKSAAKEKVKEATSKETEKAQSAAVSKSLESTLGAAPTCPWVMEKATTKDQMKSYADALGDKSEEECKTLGTQLCQRVQYNKKIVEGMENNSIPYEGTLKSQAESELSKWTEFYGALTDKRIHYVPEMVKKSDGSWTNNSSHLMIPSTRPVHVFVKDGKGRFCTLAGDAIFVEANDVQAATNDCKFYKNLRWVLEPFAQAKDERVEQMYYASRYSIDAISEAIDNNKVENIEHKDRPKAGSMNATWRAKALQLAKQEDNKVVDVVITSSRWDVKKNALGTPINRIIYGYVFYKDQYGTKASSRSWDQKHEGGGKYGALGNHGVGAKADFYVK